MLTEFGKELRKVRLDLGITLYEMAKKTGVSSSFLSNVETGKRTATSELVDKISVQFEPVLKRKDEFQRLADETKSEVRIRLKEKNGQANKVALAFARNFDTLTADQLAQLANVFNLNRKSHL